ncbi:MAG: molybdate ABC transporter permease subunit [Bacteroidota bacterium]
MPDLMPIWLSLKLAIATTCLLLLMGLPLAFLLSEWRSLAKKIAESFISLPIILPSTVMGFYLLLAFSPDSWPGSQLASLGVSIPFSFKGILIASLLYNLPFMIQPIQRAFESMPRQYWQIAYTMGKSRLETLFYVILPNMKSAILTGVVLTFAHTMGEFGIILMIGGNIPGETKVASLAIYSDLEAMNYQAAHFYSVILLSLSLLIILLLNLLNKTKASNAIH